MIHYVLPESAEGRRLPFYLAMEEWVAARHGAEADGFFTWQVDPTVIFGRNQQIEVEVNMGYCREHGIDVFRRKSGGGCVFADRSNLMVSFIAHRPEDISSVFARYTGRVAEVLRSFGIAAESSGRNDIMIGGRKVSGNAFYRTPTGASIVHGTMLFDTDMSHMTQAITPGRSKLESKGVKSVESRITMLCEHSDITPAQFTARVAEMMCDGEYRLGEADVAEVERLSQPYYQQRWIMGKMARTTHRRSRYIDGVGSMTVAVELNAADEIVDMNLWGDFFPTADIDAILLRPLRGVRYTREAVADVLGSTDVSKVIAGMNNEQLLNLLF